MKKSTLFGNLLVVIALASFVACGSAPKEETAAEEAVEEVAAEVEEVVEETDQAHGPAGAAEPGARANIAQQQHVLRYRH